MYKDLYPIFAEKTSFIIADLQTWLDKHHPGYTVRVTETFRTASYQNRLWRKGRTSPPIGKQYRVTNCDGYIVKSNHQSSLSFDIAFINEDKKVDWNVPETFWNYFGHLCRKYSLKWGGDWKSFKDRPHCEWDTKDKGTYKKAREWQKQNGLR